MDGDGDGITNVEEYRRGLVPNKDSLWGVAWSASILFYLDTIGMTIDTDSDGIPDWWERRYTGEDTALAANATADASGMTFKQKFVAYLDPTDPNAVFAIRTESLDGTEGLTISWDTADGRRYKLYGKASLTEGWPLLPIHEVLGDGQPKSFTAPKDAGSARFFRLTVEVLPEE